MRTWIFLSTILICGIASCVFVYTHTNQGVKTELNAYLAESSTFTNTTVKRVESTFHDIYISLRTIARLPGTRSNCFTTNSQHEYVHEPSTIQSTMNRGGTILDESTRLTIQEIYSSLSTSACISELYIVPLHLDPDGLDPTHTSPRSPSITFDQNIEDEIASKTNTEVETQEEEIEIYEYRMMQVQLDWFMKNYPNTSTIGEWKYPMISASEVITCDNRYMYADEHNDKDRSGILFSVPYFNEDGMLSGCITCVILSKHLSNLLYSGDYAILNPTHDYSVGAQITGQWYKSLAAGYGTQLDNSLLYSELHAIQTQDILSSWHIWAGHPDSVFWNRSGIREILKTRYLGFCGVAIFTLGSMFSVLLLLQSHRRLATLNMTLESTVKVRTSAFLNSRNSAIKALDRERKVASELRSQQHALNEHAIVTVTDTSGVITYANDKFCEISGYTKEELIGNTHKLINSGEHSPEFFKGLWDTITSGNVFTGDIRAVSKDGTYFWVRSTIVPFKNEQGEITKYSAIRTDITMSKELEFHLLENNNELAKALKREQVTAVKLGKAMVSLEKLATTDKLTGLPNRGILVDRLENALSRSRRFGTHFALLFFDFDRFKLVNDSLGHEVGDALLKEIAKIFLAETRESDTVARFGGDEFLVLLENLTDTQDACQKAEKLLHAFSKTHFINGHQLVVTASIGLVTNSIDYNNPSDMIRNADIAMYQAKARGKAQIVEFDDAMHVQTMERYSLEVNLGSALENNQLRLVYQPIINLGTEQLIGFEALLRWDHPTLGVVSPLSFIPLAEDSGLIIPIGKWVLQTASAQISSWNKKNNTNQLLKMSVNVSKRQLLNHDFVNDLIECKQKCDLKQGELLLEVTETTIIEDLDYIVPLLHQIHKCGILLAIDDFGTGVSSLSALHKFPVDVLKIDQSFIRKLDQDESLLAIVSSISNLAKHLGITTVAEGIETSKTATAMKTVGCTFGQGYLYSKPLSLEDAEAFLDRHLSLHTPKRAA